MLRPVVSISISQHVHGKSTDLRALRVVGLDEASHVDNTGLGPVTTTDVVHGRNYGACCDTRVTFASA